MPGSVIVPAGSLFVSQQAAWALSRGENLRAVLKVHAERDGRAVSVLTTAPGELGEAPEATPAAGVAELRPRLAALKPKPWNPDRAAASSAIGRWHAGNAVAYIADGLRDGPAWDAFAVAMAAAGPALEFRDGVPPARLLLAPRAEADRLVARVVQAPRAGAEEVAVLAQSGDGRTLARVAVAFPPGATSAEAAIRLPPELRNRLTRLALEGSASAGSAILLDERWRRRPVGLLAGEAVAADAPLTGQLFYLRRALDPSAELRAGDLASLLSRELSVLVLADHVVADGPEHDAIARWVEQGGLLLRFAGPRTAEHPDTLLPVKLLAGDRQLGGAMSWSQPAALAPFPPGSPFAGLVIPPDVRVTRQVLAEPGAHLAEATWAKLTDGTPLVTQAARGAGRVVLFHVSANADWSDLALSGLYVEMLRRLVDLSVGVTGTDAQSGPPLAPAEIMDGFGQLGAPPAGAGPVTPDELATAAASPRHPPGFYGPESGRRALNLATALPPLEVAPALAGSTVEGLGALPPERALAPLLLAAALALLAVDLLLSLRLRGLLRPAAAAAALALLLAAAPARAEPPADPALATHLAYIVTGDDQLDSVSRAGLAGLSDYVNRRTATALADPAAVSPGRDDLSFYPLLYWPIAATSAAPTDAAIAALNDYMAHGGIILIDTRDGGSGAGFAPGAEDALEQFGRGLAIPTLAPLTSAHVLARAFYLLADFPGRYTGDTVWVQRDQDRANDSVSPVIIGGHDWAAAWAVDVRGNNPYATIPGGARQRTLAYRFGVNLVIYALTGNYKGDQVHVPALLERLGQ